MDEYTAWDLYSAPLFFAREDNNDTIAQRLEEATNRRGQGSQRRRNMLRYEGPHGRRYQLTPSCIRRLENRRERLELRSQLRREELPALYDNTPIIDDLGLPENYVSGIYPYFTTEPQEEETASPSCYDDDWDDAYDADFWRGPSY